jgi:hypothetical protein
MRQKELVDKKEQRGYWFNRLWPMTKVKQTWQEKQLAKEENGSNGDSSSEGEVGVTSDKGGSNPESGNGNSGSGNGNPGEEEDRREEQPTWMDINMVFMIPAEFRAPAEDIAEMMLGAGRAMFEKPENPRAGGWRCKHQHLAVVTVQEVGPHRR